MISNESQSKFAIKFMAKCIMTNEQFMGLKNARDPVRPKNDRAFIISDTIQMIKNLISQVERLNSEYVALSEESRELTQEKNDLREEKTSLKTDIENLNGQKLQRVKTVYPWAGMDNSVMMHPSLQPLPIPSRNWKDISMDFITNLPSPKRCSCVLVVVDRLSNYGLFIPRRTPITARRVATRFELAYGRPPPRGMRHLSEECRMAVVSDVVLSRDEFEKQLRVNLERAQDRMRRMRNQANKSRRGVKFRVEDHSVEPALPKSLDFEFGDVFDPEKVLCVRDNMSSHGRVREVLVHWKDRGEEESAWVELEELRNQFPDSRLEDKAVFEGVEVDVERSEDGKRFYVRRGREKIDVAAWRGVGCCMA